MKTIWSTSFAVLLAGCMLVGAVGCAKNDDGSSSGDSSSAAESSAEASQEEDSQSVTESSLEDMNYQLVYDNSTVPDDMASTIASYFYAIETQNYALYLKQLNPLYQTSMEDMLQEDYGYGLETSLEQFHQTLVEYAETDSFNITALNMAQANDVLSDNYDSGTDFVSEYMDAYTQVFGEDFTKQLQSEATDIYDVAITISGESDSGEAFSIDDMEMLVVEIDGKFGILG